MTAKHSIKLRPVLAGEEYSLAVEGGYVRRPVPADGIVIEEADSEIFLPADKLREALANLESRQSTARSATRKSPQRAEQLSLEGPGKHQVS